MRRLELHDWGGGETALVCLHGATGCGGHFVSLAERLGPEVRIVAPDLLGHGRSPHEPPWSIVSHLDAILQTLGEVTGAWLGHSFGARLAFEVAARRPDLVERLVLLDPALHLPPHVARLAAESARSERSYDSFDEAVERRFEESQLHRATRAQVERELEHHLEQTNARWRYRYAPAAVVTAYGELATPPPPFDAVRIPTLLVLGEHSYLTYDHLLEDHRAAIGELLDVVVVPAGHTVLWDAPDETADAVATFLARR